MENSVDIIFGTMASFSNQTAQSGERQVNNEAEITSMAEIPVNTDINTALRKFVGKWYNLIYPVLIMFAYNVLLIFLFFMILPFLPLIYMFSEKRRHNMIKRFGIYTDIITGNHGKKKVWIHALSVGEVKSAIPLVNILKKQNPDYDIIFTVTTKTGFDTAEAIFSRDLNLQCIQIVYFPFDLIFSVKRVISLIKPDLVILVESDIWPNFLWILNRKKIPVCLVNARLSKRSEKGYGRFKFFFKNIFSCFTMIFAQTETDAERFAGLGIPDNKIQISGNIKFDENPPYCPGERLLYWRKLLNLSEENRVIIAGSTHKGEEKSIAAFYKDIKKKFPEISLILVPRDPQRAGIIAGDYARMGIDVSLLTDVENGKEPMGVVIVDKLGVLAELYALADVAFVGGSMEPFGGHNPLEPACFSKPVLFGPHMTDFADIANMLIAEKGAMTVNNTEELYHAVSLIMKDDTIRKNMGDNAARVFYSNKGAALRVLNGLQTMAAL